MLYTDHRHYRLQKLRFETGWAAMDVNRWIFSLRLCCAVIVVIKNKVNRTKRITHFGKHLLLVQCPYREYFNVDIKEGHAFTFFCCRSAIFFWLMLVPWYCCEYRSFES